MVYTKGVEDIIHRKEKRNMKRTIKTKQQLLDYGIRLSDTYEVYRNDKRLTRHIRIRTRKMGRPAKTAYYQFKDDVLVKIQESVLVYLWFHDEIPAKHTVAHINGVSLDNHESNLTLITQVKPIKVPLTRTKQRMIDNKQQLLDFGITLTEDYKVCRRGKFIPPQLRVRGNKTYITYHINIKAEGHSGYKGINLLEYVIVYLWYHNTIPEGHIIEHIDGNDMNNRIENLRLRKR